MGRALGYGDLDAVSSDGGGTMRKGHSLSRAPERNIGVSLGFNTSSYDGRSGL